MLRAIHNETDYQIALDRLYDLIQSEPKENTPLFNEMEILAILIKDYEAKTHALPLANPIEAIKFHMERLNLNESDLNQILGSRSRKSEILSGKRKLSLNMIRRLHDQLKIPAESLIRNF